MNCSSTSITEQQYYTNQTNQSRFCWKIRSTCWQGNKLHELRMRNKAKTLLHMMCTTELDKWTRHTISMQLLQHQLHQWRVRQPNYTICYYHYSCTQSQLNMSSILHLQLQHIYIQQMTVNSVSKKWTSFKNSCIKYGFKIKTNNCTKIFYKTDKNV